MGGCGIGKSGIDPSDDASDAPEKGRADSEYISSLLLDRRKLKDGGCKYSPGSGRSDVGEGC
jgi:hypothetical protein